MGVAPRHALRSELLSRYSCHSCAEGQDHLALCDRQHVHYQSLTAVSYYQLMTMTTLCPHSDYLDVGTTMGPGANTEE